MGTPARGVAPLDQSRDVEARVRRFRRGFRRRIRQLVIGSDRVADLLIAFPAAVFALATDRVGADQKADAIRMVEDGRPLGEIARALELPMWLRKLPPEAFVAPLARELPASPAFAARIRGFVPGDPAVSANWLAWVSEAATAADEAFALWLAQQPMFRQDVGAPFAVLPLALYAWFSERRQTPAGRLIEAPWHPRMGAAKAIRLTRSWLADVRAEVLAGTAAADAWLAPGRVGGYRVVPLLTADDLVEEGREMCHCAGEYIQHVERGYCRLFSMRRGAHRIATIEVRAHQLHPGIPLIVQLFSRENTQAPQHVWKAAFLWLAKQQAYAVPQPGANGKPQPAAKAWERMWQPYWLAKGAHPLLEETPRHGALEELETRVQQLAARVT